MAFMSLNAWVFFACEGCHNSASGSPINSGSFGFWLAEVSSATTFDKLDAHQAMKVWNIETCSCEQVLGGHLDNGPKARLTDFEILIPNIFSFLSLSVYTINQSSYVHTMCTTDYMVRLHLIFAVHGQADSAGGRSATPATWTLKSLLFQRISVED